MIYKIIILTLLIIALPLGAQSQVINVDEGTNWTNLDRSIDIIHLNNVELHLANCKIDVRKVTGRGIITGDDNSRIYISDGVERTVKIEAIQSNEVVSIESPHSVVPAGLTYNWMNGNKTLILIRFAYRARKLIIWSEGKPVKIIELQNDQSIYLDTSTLPRNLEYIIQVLSPYRTEAFKIKL